MKKSDPTNSTKRNNLVQRRNEKQGRRFDAPQKRTDPSPPNTLGLSKEFISGKNWTAPLNRNEFDRSQEEKFVAVLRRPPHELSPGLDNRFVAINRRTYKGDPAEIERPTHQRFWEARMGTIPSMFEGLDAVKAGPIIYKHLGLNMSLRATAKLLGLNSINPETADAAQMAIFNAFNTSIRVPDLDTVVFALATFMHAHPHFQHMTAEDKFFLPFGVETSFRLQKPHGFIFR